MPDGRMISKTIAHSVQLGEVSLEADYLFARCIPHLDSAGRMSGHPALVKATACPLRPEITAELIPDLLRQLEGAGLVQWYQVDGKQVLHFPGFKNHQRGTRFDREAASRYPDPPSDASPPPPPGTPPGSGPDEVRTNSGPGSAKGEVEVEVEVEVQDPPGVAHARETPIDPDAEEAEEVEQLPDDTDLALVPGDFGERVIPLRPGGEEALPFGALDWEGRTSASVVLREWINLQPTKPSKSDRDRFGRACRQLADEHTVGELAFAFIGMGCIWPWAPKPVGEGRTWTPEDLRRDFVRAFPAALQHPQLKSARFQQEFDSAVAGGAW